jgi:alpha-galactosidase
MRTYGNMFRACDCPNDSLSNRQRTIDVRLLCGNTAVHADPLMWNNKDTVESAALYLINTLYSVPQISVKIDSISEKHYKMIKYWLNFWRQNREVLLDGKLIPMHPEANYSAVIALNGKKLIAALYSSSIVSIPDLPLEDIILINGSYEKRLLLETKREYGKTGYAVYNCCGEVTKEEVIDLKTGINSFDIPPSGLIVLKPELGSV